ncbi:DMT family transporter [Corynebacterium tapiri]|uniref:DMT family transporter n=1 Tax=Corynebacterium tapiri TaxID=1448266 RepID=A0A5C4U357_9CORY|nr:DMT family transporter [Corynebacterium tapiri]TNL97378.1 hypothetical protein FHE74_06840 [Corynebacterium tapiri]
MHNNLVAVIFALASALTIAWGTVVRHRIAGEATLDGTLKGSPLINAITRPLWWAGTSTALLGYGFQIIALAFGTLLVVQPILVLSLMFTLPLAARYDGRRLHSQEIIWSCLLTIAVTVLVLLGRPAPGDPHPPLSRWMWALALGLLVMTGLGIAARWMQGPPRALTLGIVTGGIFGYVAVLSKGFVDIAVNQGVFSVLTSWETYALIAGATLGTIVQQYSFNAGQLRHSLPAMTAAEPVFAFSLGYAVLGEQFQVKTIAGWCAMAVSLVVMIASTVLLSRRGI